MQKEIPFVFFLMFFPLIEVVTMVPISINGMGVRELLLVYFLKYANVEGAFAMSFAILVRLILVILALVGGAMLIVKRPAKESSQ